MFKGPAACLVCLRNKETSEKESKQRLAGFRHAGWLRNSVLQQESSRQEPPVKTTHQDLSDGE